MTTKQRVKLTAEQRQFLAEMMAEMMRDNEKREHPELLSLKLPRSETTQFNVRISVSMHDAITDLAKTMNATKSYVSHHLIDYALTKNATKAYNDIIATLNATR